MNAQIGKNINNKFSLYGLTNRNGKRLTDFTLENELTCLDTKLQKRKGKLWTDTYSNNAKAQVDYILTNKKWINSTLNCEAYSFFEGVSSNHRIITAKICLCLRTNVGQKNTTTQYDWFLLNKRDTNDKYTITLKNKFDAIQEISNTYSEWWIWELYQCPHGSGSSKMHTNQTKSKTEFPRRH